MAEQKAKTVKIAKIKAAGASSKKTQADNAPVIITEMAAQKIKEIAGQEKKQGYGLKLFAVPGGCSGFQYGMDFEEKPAKDDIQVEQHGLKVFIEKSSLEFLKGAKIDFVDGKDASGFKIDNPNVPKSCSCSGGCH